MRRTADELGYRRNVTASSLRRGATGTIGVLVPRLTDTVMALMFESVERAARKRGQFAVVATCGDEPDDERRATETLLDRGVDGVILATARLDDRCPHRLRDRGIPHALVLRTDGISPSSLGDDEAGGYLAVRHLVDLGHRDIAVVTGPWFTSSARDRLAGAPRALTEASLPPDRVISGGYGVDDGIAAADPVPARDRPTAIFAANDNIAIGVLSAARVSARIGAPIGRRLQRRSSRLPTARPAYFRPDAVRPDRDDGLRAPAGDPAGLRRMRKAMPTLIPARPPGHADRRHEKQSASDPARSRP